jgi:hypothetical protein
MVTAFRWQSNSREPTVTIQPRLYPCSMAFRCSKGRVVGRAVTRTACWGTGPTMPSAFAVLCAAAKSCLGSQCAIRSMVAGWGDCAGLWERRFAWLNQFRRLRVRYEKRPDMHLAFLTLACILICWKFLQSFTLGGCPVAHMELLWLPRSPFVDRDNEALKTFRFTPRSPTIHNAGARSIQNRGRRLTSMG